MREMVRRQALMISRTFKMRAKLRGLDRCPTRVTIASRQAVAEMKKGAQPRGSARTISATIVAEAENG
jgi:hypothetical protein